MYGESLKSAVVLVAVPDPESFEKWCSEKGVGSGANQEPRLRIAKWRHRPAIIVRVAVVDVVKKSGESRITATLNIEYGAAQISPPCDG